MGIPGLSLFVIRCIRTVARRTHVEARTLDFLSAYNVAVHPFVFRAPVSFWSRTTVAYCT